MEEELEGESIEKDYRGFDRLLGIDPESKIVGRRFPLESHHSQG